MNREWKWKKLSEKRELSKLDLSRRLLELSTRKSLNKRGFKETKESNK